MIASLIFSLVFLTSDARIPANAVKLSETPFCSATANVYLVPRKGSLEASFEALEAISLPAEKPYSDSKTCMAHKLALLPAEKPNKQMKMVVAKECRAEGY